MSEQKIRELGDLPNKPLAEAIFELRWKTSQIAPGLSQDPGWANLPIKYFQKLSDRYPEPVELPAAQLPEPASAYSVRNQFRAGPNKWPLTQIGPGVLTVNETTGYTLWENFEPLILEALDALREVYPYELTPIRTDLRYINSVEFDPESQIPAAFLKEYMHTTIETAPDLFDGIEEGASPLDINLSLTLPLRKPVGRGFLSYAVGMKDDKPSIIWQLIVRSADSDSPSTLDDVRDWLTDAHAIIERWFIRLTEGELIKRFRAASHG